LGAGAYFLGGAMLEGRILAEILGSTKAIEPARKTAISAVISGLEELA
jgi:hypothetical protein